MKCAVCGWEGELAAVAHVEKGWQFTSAALCLVCRCRQRKVLRSQGITKTRVVPSRQ
jgi:hypothetical protein